MRRIFLALTLGAALFVPVGFAAAEGTTMPAAPKQMNTTSVMKGRESLFPNGDLVFLVRGNNVVMIDAAKTTLPGVGSVNGNRVTMTFSNCVYEGTMANGVLSGTGRFTSGPNAGRTWTYAVRYVGEVQ